jgi:hypothetical protein
MRIKYSTTDPSQDEFDSMPRLPITLRVGEQQVEAIGLVDSGATINVLPFNLGVALGSSWDERNAVIPLGGFLGGLNGIPLLVSTKVGEYEAVRLAFAWVQRNDVPLILGQVDFFLEFQVCFYRHELEFDVTPRARQQDG